MPSGTRSVLVDAPNSLDANSTYVNARLSSVQFMDESSQGTWRLEAQDVSGGTFTLNGWSINIKGR
jgi:subtilisin-like proprotein convertase family protein